MKPGDIIINRLNTRERGVIIKVKKISQYQKIYKIYVFNDQQIYWKYQEAMSQYYRNIEDYIRQGIKIRE